MINYESTVLFLLIFLINIASCIWQDIEFKLHWLLIVFTLTLLELTPILWFSK